MSNIEPRATASRRESTSELKARQEFLKKSSWFSTKRVWNWLVDSAHASLHLKTIGHIDKNDWRTADLTRRDWFYDWLNPVHWLVWTFDFARGWMQTRKMARLLPSLPLAVCVVFASVVFVQISLRQKGWRSDQYAPLLTADFQENRPETARILLINAVNRHAGAVEYRYGLALVENRLKNERVATSIMQNLVATKGYVPAALWLIDRMYNLESFSKWSPNEHSHFRALFALLFKSSQDDPSPVQTRKRFALYLASIGLVAESVENLKQIVARDNESLLVISQLEWQMGNKAAAVQWAERAENYLRETLTENPSRTQTRINLAKAYLILSKEEECVRTLSEGYKLTQDESLKQAGGEALVAWSNRISESEPQTDANLIRRLRLLKRAVELTPRNPMVLDCLFKAVIQCTSNENSEVQATRTAILAGLDAEYMHFVVGTIDLLEGRTKEAETHFRIAAKSDSNLPSVLNNLAVVLYEKKEPDLETALKLANAAIERASEHPYLRETRGQILLRLSRFEDAIADLEFAMKASELRPAIHPALAKAYSALGMVELAAMHSREAKLQSNP